jgi:hypothetical protein
MPIKVHDDLPAAKILEREGVTIMREFSVGEKQHLGNDASESNFPFARPSAKISARCESPS